jgi:UDPglucose 6-dehydrogenase
MNAGPHGALRRIRGYEAHVNIGLAGYGFVGQALHRLFARNPAHSISVYDRYRTGYGGEDALRRLNACDLVFVAVPTPYDELRGRCDVSAVLDVAKRLLVPMCIKSTVPPGTIDALVAQTGKAIAYSPEYIGEQAGHPWPEADSAGFVLCAGDPGVCRLVREAYRDDARGAPRFVETSVAAAELAKYMENAFLATKVAFANQFYDLARAAGVEYDDVRRLFLLDERVGESHTEVRAERGFGGRCLPKDMKSIVAWARPRTDATLLEDVLDYNDRLRERARATDESCAAAS